MLSHVIVVLDAGGLVVALSLSQKYYVISQSVKGSLNARGSMNSLNIEMLPLAHRKGVFLLTERISIVMMKRVYSVNTYSRIPTVPRERAK